MIETLSKALIELFEQSLSDNIQSILEQQGIQNKFPKIINLSYIE